jgi:hypothetical protein
MSTPAPQYHYDEKEIYQFACPDCWAVRTITLVPGIARPMCDCGSPLFAIGEVESDDAECLSLDHTHRAALLVLCRSRHVHATQALVCDLLPKEL